MTTRSSPFVNARRSGLAAGVGACVLLSGCIANPFKDAIVDPRSPIAAEVTKSVNPNAPYPTFVNFPKTPAGVRPHKQYGVDAGVVEADGATLIAATADSTWTLSGTDAFAAQTRADAGPILAPPAPGDTEAFAKDLKARATPPPPVKR
jgi:hypothetical protein